MPHWLQSAAAGLNTSHTACACGATHPSPLPAPQIPRGARHEEFTHWLSELQNGETQVWTGGTSMGPASPHAPQSCTSRFASGPGKPRCAAVAVSRAAVISPPITACPHLANEGTESPAGVFQHSRAGFGTHSTQLQVEARRAQAAEPGEPHLDPKGASGSLSSPLFLLLPHRQHSECSISSTP